MIKRTVTNLSNRTSHKKSNDLKFWIQTAWLMTCKLSFAGIIHVTSPIPAKNKNMNDKNMVLYQ